MLYLSKFVQHGSARASVQDRGSMCRCVHYVWVKIKLSLQFLLPTDDPRNARESDRPSPNSTSRLIRKCRDFEVQTLFMLRKDLVTSTVAAKASQRVLNEGHNETAFRCTCVFIISFH